MQYLGQCGTDFNFLQKPFQELCDTGPRENTVGTVQHDYNIQWLGATYRKKKRLHVIYAIWFSSNFNSDFQKWNQC